MATYYHVRHIELDNIGSGKKRVLRPPGGKSSDIFGLDDSSVDTTPRRVKKHTTSNLPLGDASFDDSNCNSSQSSGSPSGSGPGTPRAGTPLGNFVLSVPNSSTPCRPVNQRRARGGNPVTGEGYEESKEEKPEEQQQQQQQQQRRQRVPPGGYSSKLW